MGMEELTMTAMTTEVLGLPRGRALTRDDLDAMPDDGHRYELLDGVLIVSPAPRTIHQRMLRSLVVRVLEACPADLELFLRSRTTSCSRRTR